MLKIGEKQVCRLVKKSFLSVLNDFRCDIGEMWNQKHVPTVTGGIFEEIVIYVRICTCQNVQIK